MNRKLGSLAAVAALLLVAGCAPPDEPVGENGAGGASGAAVSGTVNIKGSDTMVNLAQAWAEEFMKTNPGVEVAVTGGGSGTGIAALQNRTTDIATASRDIKEEEKAQIEKGGGQLNEFTVAQDALTVGVHPSNPVQSLTIEQLSDIFTGKVNDWSQVGGKPGRIVALSRERSSGTHVFFLEEVLRKGDAGGPEEFAASVLMMPASQAIVDELASNPNGIGYYGMGYHDPAKVKALAIPTEGGAPVEPTVQSVMDRSYPIARPLHLYTAKAPEGAVKAFIDYALSPKGQELVETQDFVPVSK